MTVRSQIKYPEHLGSGEGLLTTTHWGVAASTARFTGVVETFLWVTVKSIEVNLNEVQITPLIRDLGDADITATVGALFVKEVLNQFASDIPIWENKVMWRQPVLCDGDGPIGPFRRWMRQFYVSSVEEVPAPAAEDGEAAAG
jgi:3-ketosteroid 9alpha-monooxygenase subunit A